MSLGKVLLLALAIAVFVAVRRLLATAEVGDPPLASADPVAPDPEPGSLEDASRGELYREAQRLGIAGRSRMTKAELKRAIDERRDP